jgi:signal transduction histidine kinase
VPPGDYTFKVIAANSDGVWNTEGKSLRVSVLPPFYRTWWFLTLAALTLGAALGAIYKYRVTQLEGRQAAQLAFSRQLIASQEAERKRIAGELHDGLGQSLVIIRNWALLGSGQLSPDSPAKEELDEITATASRAINEVREIAYNLGPYHLERLGLANTIQDMVKRVAQISRVNITAELDPLDGVLSRETEMSVYRITQEALNNMVKHSQATEARVTLKREAAGIRLTVSDNGKGFNPQNVASPDGSGTSQTGYGLAGIAERVRLIDGALTIRSAPGQGTTIEAVVGNKSS